MKVNTVYFIAILFLFPACANPNTGDQQEIPALPTAPSTPAVEFITFQNENGTWGYDVLLNGKPYIHQPDKPAVGGRQGFEQKEQAQKVGELVMEKIKQGIMPPSVSVAEVDSLVNVL